MVDCNMAGRRNDLQILELVLGRCQLIERVRSTFPPANHLFTAGYQLKVHLADVVLDVLLHPKIELAWHLVHLIGRRLVDAGACLVGCSIKRRSYCVVCCVKLVSNLDIDSFATW